MCLLLFTLIPQVDLGTGGKQSLLNNVGYQCHTHRQHQVFTNAVWLVIVYMCVTYTHVTSVHHKTQYILFSLGA